MNNSNRRVVGFYQRLEKNHYKENKEEVRDDLSNSSLSLNDAREGRDNFETILREVVSNLAYPFRMVQALGG